MRKIIFTGAALALAASALLITSPAAFASTPAIKITVPGIQGFSSIPGSWFLLNEPDEFVVTPSSTVPAPTTQSSTSTTQPPTPAPTWVNTSHTATGQYWVSSGHWATGWYWANAGYWQSYQYWDDTSHWRTSWRWVSSGYWDYRWRAYRHWLSISYAGCHRGGAPASWDAWWCPVRSGWVNTSHWQSYQYWVSSGYWATGQYWVNTSHWQSYQYWDNTSHWQSYQYWVSSGYWQSHPAPAPIVTTTADTGINIAKETLVGVQPIIQDTSYGPYYGQEWYGTFCYGGQTPLIGPTLPGGATNPAFPNFSGSLYKYTYFFEQQHICTFNPTYVASNNVQSWWLAGNTARMVLIPQYSVTATWTQTTTVNGQVTSSVPETQTQTLNGPTFYGPPWPLYAISSISCSIQNGYTYCPGHPPVRLP
ncbi:MAG: hypothetical protein ACYDHP_12820 [Ferrimicrobium sp.]